MLDTNIDVKTLYTAREDCFIFCYVWSQYTEDKLAIEINGLFIGKINIGTADTFTNSTVLCIPLRAGDTFQMIAEGNADGVINVFGY